MLFQVAQSKLPAVIAFHVFEPPSGNDSIQSSDDECPRGTEPAPPAWSRSVRSIVSLLLVLHLLAIVSAPWAMQPSSVLAQRVFSFFQPYVDLTFLNHGYHFFAPEPGPSHLIRYELQLEDGKLITGQFPDPQVHSPRLLYHRHFMLSETANRLAVDPAQQVALDELSRSFADHLLTLYPASQATLYLRRHYIPTPEQVAAGMPLDAPELFAERLLGTFASRDSGRARALRSPVQTTTDAGLDVSRPAAIRRIASNVERFIR
jgi:hypothetical protein